MSFNPTPAWVEGNLREKLLTKRSIKPCAAVNNPSASVIWFADSLYFQRVRKSTFL